MVELSDKNRNGNKHVLDKKQSIKPMVADKIVTYVRKEGSMKRFSSTLMLFHESFIYLFVGKELKRERTEMDIKSNNKLSSVHLLFLIVVSEVESLK